MSDEPRTNGGVQANLDYKTLRRRMFDEPRTNGGALTNSDYKN